jgi:deazaflavin-dependent oxidoreductase (nitroreductase family)
MSNEFMPLWERLVGAPLLKLHDQIYRKTNGRIGHKIPFTAPILILHTVGAKTGSQRANSLSYAKDGDSYLVVASKGGDPKAPGWYFNAKANPAVEINVGPKRFPVSATIVTPDDPDYQRRWKLVNDNNNHVYEGYQTRTTRPIPIVALAP